MTTIVQLVDEIERGMLEHYSLPQLDILGANATTAATEITLTTIDQLSRGSVLEVEYELMYVLGWNGNTRVATVIRGHSGTTATAHDSGDVARVNPRVSHVSMLDAIREELRSWDDRVFNVETDTLSFGASDSGINVAPTATNIYRILQAHVVPNAANSSYKTVTLELRRNEDAGMFAGGWSVHLPPGMRFGEATTINVLYAVPFTLDTLDTSTNLISTVGLSTSMLEILKWGTLHRIMAGRQENRLDLMANLRSDIEQRVPALAPAQAAAQYQLLRDRAYANEAYRLLNKYPPRTAA